MRYIDTVILHTYIYSKQKKYLEKIQSELEKEYLIKIPISELVRQALEFGIPEVDKNRNFISDLIK